VPDLPSDLRVSHREAERALNERDYRRAHELCLRILERAPDFSDAMFLLGIIALEHGNFGKAAEVMERAIRLDPTRAEYRAHRGRCLIALNEPRAALEEALAALALNPQDALTLDTIGVVMTRAGAHAEALEPFRRAVARDPGKAAYQYNLGASLQFVGHFSDAATAYRRALALDEGYYKAWSSLAQVAREPFNAAEVATLQAALEQATGVDAQLHLCHALAKHHEDRQEYSTAFKYLERGKGAKRASLHYSSDDDRGLFDAVQSVCTAELLNEDTTGCDSIEPIFIVGMPRTGTTLIERILSSHPDVFAAGELTNFSLMLKRMARTRSPLVLDPETLHAARGIDPAQLGNSYVESTRPRTGHAPRFIDKMPLNFLYAGLIHRALPRAKIICLRRNPLDTCLSNYRQLFATSFSYYNYAYDLLDIGRYHLMFDALAAHWRTHMPRNYYEVRYESVVADTEAEARRLLAFCELSWDPACLQFHENAAPVATASSVQVRQPIYRTSVDRWRKYAEQIAPLRKLLNAERVSC
jgi:tetratricopeptide (TPR) repeat protein